MGFSVAEFAVTSEPVELLMFARDESYWAYALHDQDVVRNSVTYRAGMVTRSNFQQGEELNQVSVKVQISTKCNLGDLLQSEGFSGIRGPLFMRLTLTHANDTAVVSPFFGKAIELSRHGSYVELTIDSSMSTMKKKLLRFTGGVMCGHALYDSGCTVNMENFRVDATVVSVTGRIAAVASGSDPLNTLQTINYYGGGVLVYNRERYFISGNDDVGNLTMEDSLPSYIIGQPVILYAGCDRGFSTCDAKFNNARNFGGFPNFPVTNVFEGTR
jgi:uncharacterized phage protein (TIGR02218 family)